MNPSAPVGVFDSGVGGLSVLREMRALMPALDLLYVSDARFLPYGDKPEPFVLARSLAIADFLVARGARALVVACNTATAAAVPALRARHGVPVVGIEPAVKPAAAATRSGIVGILATSSTLQSRRYAELLERFGGFVRVIGQPCSGLVERVEAGDLDGPQTRALLERYLQPLLDAGADTLVLGCTHYPFLRPLIEHLAGPDVRVVDPSGAVARRVQEVLGEATGGAGSLRAFTTGDAAAQSALFSQLLGTQVTVEPLTLGEEKWGQTPFSGGK
jgi:glutamate racemase